MIAGLRCNLAVSRWHSHLDGLEDVEFFLNADPPVFPSQKLQRLILTMRPGSVTQHLLAGAGEGCRRVVLKEALFKLVGGRAGSPC